MSSARSSASAQLRCAICASLTSTSCGGIVLRPCSIPTEVPKTEASRTPVPIPTSLALELSAHVEAGHGGETLLTDDDGAQVRPGSWSAQSEKPAERLRTFPRAFDCTTCGHLWPDSDESTRAAIDAVLIARTEPSRNQTGTAR